MATLIKFFLFILSRVPLRILHGLGYLIGIGFISFPNRRRNTTEININLCFPNLTTTEKRRLINTSLIETGKGILETSALWYWSGTRALKLIKSTSGEDVVEELYRQNRGLILALPHLGMWEIIGHYCGHKYPTTSLYRPPPIAELDDLMRKGRERMGNTLVPTDATGIRQLYSALKRGELLCILPDQDPSAGAGEFAPFFGIQANTMTLLSRLAQKNDSPVVFSYAERLPDAMGYHIHFIKASEKILSGDMRLSLTELNKGIEELVRRRPEQYLWCYKRFRTRPEGEARFY